jgi:hypothetical protein
MKRHQVRTAGLSLVEIVITLGLMGFLCLAISSLLIKNGVFSNSFSLRSREAGEIQGLIIDLQQDLRQGVYISDNSHAERLEYTTYDTNGNATKKIYRITTNSGVKYLQLSSDGGTTWGSPYRISSYSKYRLNGTPRFLYAQSENNCTLFTDTNANGVWQSGVDTAGSAATCPNSVSSPLLTMPSQANRVDLSGFQFSTGSGSPEAVRSLLSHLFLEAKPGPVRSTAAAVAPAAKDSPLLQKFDTATANSRFGTAFGVRGLGWDAFRERLVLVGQHSSGSNQMFLAGRQGILMGTALTTATTTLQLDSVAFENGNNTILVLDATNKMLYRYGLRGATTGMTPISTLNMATPTNLINTPTGIAYDPQTPNDFYIVGTDPSTSALRIYERNISSGALVGSSWALPAAFDATHPPGGLAIEPGSGDFLVVRNYVNGSAPNQTIDIYRINRTSGSSTSFAVNINDLGSSATGTTGSWGIAYDADTNRIFLSDDATDKVYEVVPPVLISALN